MRTILLSAAAIAAIATAAEAKVLEKSATGFTVEHNVELNVDAATAYAAFVKIGSWWGKDHTYSGDSKNLKIETKPGGCWCEKLPAGGFVRHMEVVHAAPGSRLIFAGGLGPLAFMGISGSMNVAFKAANEGSTVTLSYAVGGHDQGDFKSIADGVDKVIGEQVANFATFAQTGKR